MRYLPLKFTSNIGAVSGFLVGTKKKRYYTYKLFLKFSKLESGNFSKLINNIPVYDFQMHKKA